MYVYMYIYSGKTHTHTKCGYARKKKCQLQLTVPPPIRNIIQSIMGTHINYWRFVSNIIHDTQEADIIVGYYFKNNHQKLYYDKLGSSYSITT